ncbi:ctr copper transporter [Apiospora arundinis]|uniref:Copper transport protein n=1 Tax=Apiospora arundinis TaxID=335852 RepID=A0ABR2HQP2_9PEZI
MDHSMMDMSMSMPTATATGATPSSTMDGMSHGGGGAMPMTMDMSQMAMVFFQSVTSPLFSKAWTPSGTGSYAGTCIFLVVLATLHRVLIAVRNLVFETVPHGHPKLDPALASDGEEAAMDAYRRRYGRSVGVLARIRGALHDNPFRIATETARALSELVISGMGYLLMLAVMTMNVGYFLSVLGGVFLGAFLAGRFGTVDH